MCSSGDRSLGLAGVRPWAGDIMRAPRVRVRVNKRFLANTLRGVISADARVDAKAKALQSSIVSSPCLSIQMRSVVRGKYVGLNVEFVEPSCRSCDRACIKLAFTTGEGRITSDSPSSLAYRIAIY